MLDKGEHPSYQGLFFLVSYKSYSSIPLPHVEVHVMHEFSFQLAS